MKRRVSVLTMTDTGIIDSNMSNYSEYYDEWDDDEEVEECSACYGTGLDRDEMYDCEVCGGEGEIRIVSAKISIGIDLTRPDSA